MSRQINQKKAFLALGGLLRSTGLAVPVAGVSSISNYIPQAHLYHSEMLRHPGRVRMTHFCMKLRHYQILHSVPASFFTNGRPTGSDHSRGVTGGNFMTQNETNNKAALSVSADFSSPSAPRLLSKFGVRPNAVSLRHTGSRGALFSPATFPSGVLIVTRIKLVIPSRRHTAGRASRLIRRNSVAVSPRQTVSACGSAGPLSSHQTRIFL